MVKRSTKSGVDKAKKPAKAKAVKAPPPPEKPPEKPPTTQAEINRIGDIIRNARGTWFGLLGALVFAAVTLASVKDASFFIPSEQTKLPLLGISVPITSFFWAGALLVTALYTYLHLYLVQLWDALGDVDPQFEGKPLADVIHPWLVSDAALRVRDRMRKTKDGEHCSRQRGMSMVGTLVSILLVWLFGLITIGWFWWRSMPAHDIWLTGWLGALFAWSLFVFWRSGSYALERLSKIKYPFFPRLVLYGIYVLVICGLSYLRIYVFPAPAQMAETVFTQKPSSWKGYDLTKQEFRKSWCEQIVEKACKINPLDENPLFDEKVEEKFEEAWKSQLKATLASFSKPDLRGKRLEGADLRFAQLEGVRLDKARLQGANLTGAEMQGADLTLAEMQGANLSYAKMQGADLSNAKMQGADLSNAKMQGADLTLAEMQGADLRGAEMQGANLTLAKMQGADLSYAEMQGANLSNAKMQGADLRGAEMQGANLEEAKMQGADLSEAKIQNVDLLFTQMQGVDLSYAKMQGAQENIINLHSTNLSEADFLGITLRFVDFSEAIVDGIKSFDKSFGDGSVKLAEKLKKPEGWCNQVLTDEQYWGRYQGWAQENLSVLLSIELGLISFDDEITQYPLIPFGTPCPNSHHP